MTEKNLQLIQEQLGYDFSEPNFLRQAFTRKSYSEENGTYDNEVLEFYGDKALEFIIMKKLSEYYGKISKLGYCSQKAEGQLTDIKQKLICKKSLAHWIQELGFEKYLLLGNGDREQNIQNQDSVKEDLFEAIIGAVAIDSGWCVNKIENVVDKMIDVEYYLKNGFSDEINYVNFVQTWCQKKEGRLPCYHFMETDDGYKCCLEVTERTEYEGYGKSKAEARMNAAKNAYEFLSQEEKIYTISIDDVGEPELDRAINQLQELYQKGLVGEPKYNFEEYHEANGNPYWYCECRISHEFLEGEEYVAWEHCASKKQGKKLVAYNVLWQLMNRRI